MTIPVNLVTTLYIDASRQAQKYLIRLCHYTNATGTPVVVKAVQAIQMR